MLGKIQSVSRHAVGTESNGEAVNTIIAVKNVTLILPLDPEFKSVGFAGGGQLVQIDIVIHAVKAQGRSVSTGGPSGTVHECDVVPIARGIMCDRSGAFVKGISG